MKTDVLEHIGLTRNESIVYLTLLQLGTSKTGGLLKRSGLHSGKIYEILESLKAKGLVSESIINGVRHFTAAPPKELLSFIDQKKQEIQHDEQQIRAVLPELEKLRVIARKEVQAFVYTGLRGIKTAADEALAEMKPDEDIVAMGITVHKEKKFNEFWKLWSKERIAKKIRARHIFSERSSYYDTFKMLRFTEARVLTALTPAAIDVFGLDKVLILNYEGPGSCILVYDKNTATSFRQFFEQLWNIAKP